MSSKKNLKKFIIETITSNEWNDFLEIFADYLLEAGFEYKKGKFPTYWLLLFKNPDYKIYIKAELRKFESYKGRRLATSEFTAYRFVENNFQILGRRDIWNNLNEIEMKFLFDKHKTMLKHVIQNTVRHIKKRNHDWKKYITMGNWKWFYKK